MKKFVNDIEIQGYVFNLGNNKNRQLQKKISGPSSKNPGTEFIQGELNVATDEHANNVVTVYYSYVPKMYPERNGRPAAPNPNYDTLERIIDGGNTFEANGVAADKVRVSCSYETNDFYNRDGELVSAPRIRGSFIHFMNGPIKANSSQFKIDMLITGFSDKSDNDNNPYITLEGYCFDYVGHIMPISVNVRSEGGVNYFASEEPSKKSPLLTTVWGNYVSMVGTRIVEHESAFGEPEQEEVPVNIKSFDVTGASPEPMIFDDESTITKDELKAALENRNVYLAAERKRQDEYNASKQDSKSAFSQGTNSVSTNDDDDDDDDDFPF